MADDDQGRKLLARVASVLHGYHQVSQSIYHLTQYRPSPGSPAQLELQVPEHQREYVRASHSIAAAYLTAAQDFIVSLSKQFEEPLPLYGPIALARACLENSARAWWMLDPDISREERVSRGFVERFNSLYEAAEVERAMGVPTPKSVQRAEEVAADARELGFPTIIKRGRWRLVEPARPFATDLLESMGGHLGKVVYKFASGAVHGTTYALLQNLEVERRKNDGDTEELFFVPRRGLEPIVTLAGIAVTCLIDAFDRQLALYGWPNDEWTAWNVHAMDVLQEAHRAVEGSGG
jgi:hypothetical protein